MFSILTKLRVEYDWNIFDETLHKSRKSILRELFFDVKPLKIGQRFFKLENKEFIKVKPV